MTQNILPKHVYVRSYREHEWNNFECPDCGHVEHPDVNAAFNIALSPNIVRFSTESDQLKGNTDVPKVVMA